jgi:hypothetical protein
MSTCPSSGRRHDIMVTSFQACLEGPILHGRSPEDHFDTCCEITGCDNANVIDRRCKPYKIPPIPHFGDIRPEGVKHNPKYIHRGIGVL